MNTKLKYAVSIVSIVAFIILCVFLENRKGTSQVVHTQVVQASGYGFADVDAIKEAVEKSTKGAISDSLSKRLFSVEDQITKNPYIEKAIVYLQPSGEILVQLWEEIPMARVVNDSSNYYICISGKSMPVKAGAGADVPLVYGKLGKGNIDGVRDILSAMKQDDFFNGIFTGVRISHYPKNGTEGYIYTVDTRLDGLSVVWGDQSDMSLKIDNFKVLYSYLSREDRLKDYKSVNLEFVNYVICQKK